MHSRSSPLLACAALAAAAGTAAMLPTFAASGWNVTALVRLGAGSRLATVARTVDPGFHLARHGYDGQFYWAVAVDPLASGSLPAAFDKPTYRYGHPLYAWAGRVVAFARADWVAAALVLTGLASLAGAAALAAALARDVNGSWRIGLLTALNPGLLVAVSHDLAEPLAAAILLGALAAHRSRRHPIAWTLFALAPLAKESLLLVPLAVAAWALSRRRIVHAAVVASALLPAAAWWVYVRLQLGGWFTSGATALATPFSGWAETFAGPDPRRLSSPALATLAALLAVVAVAAVRALSRRGVISIVYLALLAVVVCLAPNATWAFSTALRNLSFVLVLAPLLLFAERDQPDSRPLRDPPTARGSLRRG